MSYEWIASGRVRGALGVVCLLVVTACGGIGTSPSTVGPGSHDDIRRDQIQAADKNALEVIMRLHPAWLRPRGRASLRNDERSYAAVMLDDVLYGSVDSLRSIPSESIDRIYFMSAADATTRYGTGYLGGIIHVRTVR